MRGVALGAGYFAPYHYEAWTRIPEAGIVAMFTPSEDKDAPIMAKCGVPRFYYLRTIEVVDAAYESARQGQVIHLGRRHA